VDLLQIIFFPGYGTVVCLDVHEEKYRSESDLGRPFCLWVVDGLSADDGPAVRARPREPVCPCRPSRRSSSPSQDRRMRIFSKLHYLTREYCQKITAAHMKLAAGTATSNAKGSAGRAN
jgi:hypothetical protein